ncbi:RNA 2',3'-cyclic phosphodiesterase [Streptomyces sp. NBC_00872]|uniref:RNA 2',3'-cyclic phosphodiesterase n=1 Tax=Streptomyces sp. NBC_00872 TaxID=2903686 RepID=UPI003868F2A6|nr:RNA 2',3'-cyclic phosphodiesterase [Streptomyces sp. NBC_00872]
MRLFAAVLPPVEAREELGPVLGRLKALPGAEGLRWTGWEGWHFTLAFMGEVEDALVPELTARLERAGRRTEPFPLGLRGGGHFGGRALWAGAAGDIDTLRRLAERAGAAARRTGLPMEEHRRYRPHLTLAHSRTDLDLRPYTTAMDGFEGTPWEVAELALVRSRLPVSGVPHEQPRYETLARFPLGKTGNGNPGAGHGTPGR